MPNLSPAQLAEGARLLDDYAHHVTPALWELWHDWLLDHGEDLLAAAQRAAEVEGCVREIVTEIKDQSEWSKKHEREQDDGCLKIHWHGATIGTDLASGVVARLARKHNIDLSEPTPTGEAKGGEG